MVFCAAVTLNRMHCVTVMTDCCSNLKGIDMKILQLNTSAPSIGANSTRLADAITARLKTKHPAAAVMLRDLSKTPHPPLDKVALTALSTPPAQRTPAQAARVALDNALIAELKSADVLVLGVYNFSIPAQLKAWIDVIARAGETCRYTENGPQGLLTGKKAFVALTCGGSYHGTAADLQVPYLKGIFKFLGITDVEFIDANGLAMGEEAISNGFGVKREPVPEITVHEVRKHPLVETIMRLPPDQRVKHFNRLQSLGAF